MLLSFFYINKEILPLFYRGEKMSKQDIIDYVMDTPHNINPAILNQKLGEMEVQPDWNQNNPTAPDYVKNRPFYTEMVEEVILDGELEFDTENVWLLYREVNRQPVDGEQVIVILNGETYVCNLTYIAEDDFYIAQLPNGAEVQAHPQGDDCWEYAVIAQTAATAKVIVTNEVARKLDAKYLPTPDLVITISHSLDWKVNASDVDITGGSVEAVCEKLLSGVPVDIRVRGFEKAESYAAYADEVTARGFYYAGKLHVSWLVIYGSQIRISRIFFNMDGTISSIFNEKVATTEY